MSTKWQPPRPSAYTPFLRRFTDERARELTDSRHLFEEVTARYKASGWSDKSAFFTLLSDLSNRVDDLGGVPDSLENPFTAFSTALLSLESELFPIEEVDWNNLLLDEQVNLRTQLRAQQFFLAHETLCVETFVETLALFMTGIASDLVITDSPDPLFEMPLFFLLKDTNETLEAIFATLADDKFIKLGLFEDVGRQLYLNLAHASNLVPDVEQKKPFIYPSEKKLAPQDAVDTYLGYTPFRDLLSTPAPFTIPDKSFFEHMHVIGGTGAGKTTWLSQLIHHHLKDPRKPSVVVLRHDPTDIDPSIPASCSVSPSRW